MKPTVTREQVSVLKKKIAREGVSSETINKQFIAELIVKKIGTKLKDNKPSQDCVPLIYMEAEKIVGNFSSLSKSVNIKNLNLNFIWKGIRVEADKKRLENFQDKFQ